MELCIEVTGSDEEESGSMKLCIHLPAAPGTEKLPPNVRGGFEHPQPGMESNELLVPFPPARLGPQRLRGSYVQSRKRRTAAIPLPTSGKGFCFLSWEPHKAQEQIHMQLVLPIKRGRRERAVHASIISCEVFPDKTLWSVKSGFQNPVGTSKLWTSF